MNLHLGTDGWRGVIAEACTFEAIRGVAGGLARWLASARRIGDDPRVVVGYDPRFFSPEFAAAAADVLARAGSHVLLSDRPIPSPAVSFHVHRLGLAAGVSITASHNPARYNGFKIKAHFGGSAPPETYDAVANEIGGSLPHPERPGRVDVQDLYSPYRERLWETVDLHAIRAAGLSILADAMHGAAGSILAEVANGGATRVVPFRSERDALFGGVNPEPIAANLSAAAERVRRDGLHLAVATDGDADRLGVLDRRGAFVSPHRVLALLLLHAFRRRGLSGGIARTFSTSLLIDRIAKKLGAPLIETPIGFKHVAELMNRGDAVAGGEESGGYAFAFHLPERDGVLGALLLIESLALSGSDLDRALRDLGQEFGEFSYGRRDVYLPVDVVRAFVEERRANPPRAVAGQTVTSVHDLDGVKYLFGESGWLLHRLSGTEPLIRLYCEHEREETMTAILEETRSGLDEFARSRGATPASHT